MALPASDSFTAADGTALTTYSANWSNVAGQFKINNNACEPNGEGDNAARWITDTFANDQYAEATISNLTASGYIGVAVRCSASANTHYGVVSNSNDATYLYKYVNGSSSTLDTAAVFAEGDIMRLEAEGTTIRVKKNGTQILSVTDSSISSGSAGVAGAGTSTDSQIDNWTAGNLGAATVYPVVAWFRRRPAMMIDSWRMATRWADSIQSTFQRLRFLQHRISSNWLRRRTRRRASGCTV